MNNPSSLKYARSIGMKDDAKLIHALVEFIEQRERAKHADLNWVRIMDLFKDRDRRLEKVEKLAYTANDRTNKLTREVFKKPSITDLESTGPQQ